MCQRCYWATHSELEQAYHDAEWGMPQTADRLLFEFLVLEGAQAGLSWRTVLEKREGYRALLDNFDPAKIVHYNDEYLAQLQQDSRIIRNKLKIASVVKNARAFLAIQAEYGSFARYLWSFVDNRPLQNHVDDYRNVPAETAESQALSKALKKAGMTFVGLTICYAYMQAIGMVNDHEVSCHRYDACRIAGETFQRPQ